MTKLLETRFSPVLRISFTRDTAPSPAKHTENRFLSTVECLFITACYECSHQGLLRNACMHLSPNVQHPGIEKCYLTYLVLTDGRLYLWVNVQPRGAALGKVRQAGKILGLQNFYCVLFI